MADDDDVEITVTVQARVLEDALRVKDGAGHIAAIRVTEWLERERLLGLITPEGARAVEKLIEDLR
jgi:hypothetical protein